jgi:hypothetical protein
MSHSFFCLTVVSSVVSLPSSHPNPDPSPMACLYHARNRCNNRAVVFLDHKTQFLKGLAEGLAKPKNPGK